jgi:hypothetical protein
MSGLAVLVTVLVIGLICYVDPFDLWHWEWE